MGLTALFIFLGSLAMALLSLLALVWSGLQIYRTLRYARKDSQPWLKLFTEYGRQFQEVLKVMERRARNITDIGMEMRERVDYIQDVVEELRHSHFVKAARLAGKPHNQ